MNDDSAVQFLAARSRKRSRQISDSSHSHGQSSWQERDDISSSSDRPNVHSSRSHLALPTLPPMRYPGDGFDFRRPVMSTPRQTEEEVIDLTNEPDSPPQRSHQHAQQDSRGGATPRRARPPRFGRNIMDDVVDLEEEEPEPVNDTPSSPEVQFMGAHRNSDVEFVRSTVRPVPSRPRSLGRSEFLSMLRFRAPIIPLDGTLSNEEALRQEIAWRARHLPQRPPRDVETFWIDGPRSDFDLAVDLSFNIPDESSRMDSAARPSSYKPPSPAPEGFTRNAKENDVVVCPNCDEELGTGDEVKQQIWVAKPCGHVYCGECARNRSLAKAKKAVQSSRTKVKPFSKCQVAGCGKPVSAPKSMFQIYL